MNAQIIYDYGKNPVNFQELPEADLTHKELNHICGEEITIYIKFKKDTIIDEITFQADGRMVTLAAASLLTEELEDNDLADVQNISKDDVLRMLGLQEKDLTSKRLKSATLGLLAIKNAYRTLKKQEPLGYEDILN